MIPSSSLRECKSLSFTLQFKIKSIIYDYTFSIFIYQSYIRHAMLLVDLLVRDHLPVRTYGLLNDLAGRSDMNEVDIYK